MGGSPATVNPGDYIKRPSMDMEAALLGQKNQMGLMFLKNQADMLKLASNITPQMQEFSPEQVSREAGELGMANLARSRKYEELASPEAAQMRRDVPRRLQEATSKDAWKKQMEEWAKTKGIPAMSATGIDPDSTISRSALFDMSTQAGRDFELGNIAAQQGYVNAYGAPTGGLDPGALMAGKQAAEVANKEAVGRWQAGLLGAAQGLGASAADFGNTGIGDLLSLSQANRANQQAYQQMLYQGAAQNAAARNAQQAAMIGALGNLGGMATQAGAMYFGGR
jgi:hypothetical protein